MLAAFRTALFRPALLRQRVGLASMSVRSFADDAPKSAAAGSTPAASAPGTREAGTVKWFDAAKGFGFIVRDSGNDVFVHFSGIRGTGYRTLEEGQKVDFVVQQGVKGLTATDVAIKH